MLLYLLYMCYLVGVKNELLCGFILEIKWIKYNNVESDCCV